MTEILSVASQRQISKERYDKILERYNQFVILLDKPGSVPVRVFDPLSAKHIEEVELIRDISLLLQKKKIEDMERHTALEVDKQVKDAEKETSESDEQNS